MAITDTRCNHHSGNLQMPGEIIGPTLHRPTVRIHNGTNFQASHECLLPFKNVPSKAKQHTPWKSV
eukprot:15327332-Ditylum_brightwellii.AAC.2